MRSWLVRRRGWVKGAVLLLLLISVLLGSMQAVVMLAVCALLVLPVKGIWRGHRAGVRREGGRAMTWTIAAIQAMHAWRLGAHTRRLHQYEDEPDADRVVEELVSDLVISVIGRAERIAADDGAERIIADHVSIAARQVNLRVRVMIERGVRSAA